MVDRIDTPWGSIDPEGTNNEAIQRFSEWGERTLDEFGDITVGFLEREVTPYIGFCMVHGLDQWASLIRRQFADAIRQIADQFAEAPDDPSSLLSDEGESEQ